MLKTRLFAMFDRLKRDIINGVVSALEPLLLVQLQEIKKMSEQTSQVSTDLQTINSALTDISSQISTLSSQLQTLKSGTTVGQPTTDENASLIHDLATRAEAADNALKAALTASSSTTTGSDTFSGSTGSDTVSGSTGTEEQPTS